MKEKLENLRFGIVGYGRMGRMVEKALIERNLKIGAIVDPDISPSEPLSRALEIYSNDLNALATGKVDIAICFTSPDAGDSVTRTIMEMGIDQAIATTKFYLNPDGSENNELLKEYDELAKENNCRAIYAANFSLGMNAMWKFLGPISKVMAAAGYDVAVEERHHKGKADIAGSAKKIARVIIDNGYGDRVPKYNYFEQKREPNEITVIATRCGSISGTHTVIFDSPIDTFEITHRVKDPLVFPKGAIDSAVWLKEQKPGLYGIENRLNS